MTVILEVTDSSPCISYSVEPLFQLLKEYPYPAGLNIHENLIEALLEMQAYSDVQVRYLHIGSFPFYIILNPHISFLCQDFRVIFSFQYVIRNEILLVCNIFTIVLPLVPDYGLFTLSLA